MKRCPACRRDYFDESLLYCLDDGSALLDGPISSDEAKTRFLPETDVPEVHVPGDLGRRRFSRTVRWLVPGVLILSGLAGVLILFFKVPNARSFDPNKITLTPLTNDIGYEGEPTFSPDGETIAYVSDRSGNFEIYIQQVSGGSHRNITENGSDDVQPAYSPDGKQIAFVSTRSMASTLRWEGYDLPMMGGDVWVMPALGGEARRIAKDGNFPSWSHDGSAILYTSGPAFKPKIYRVNAVGGEPTELIPNLDPKAARPRFFLYPSYSADEKYVVFEADSPTSFGPRDVWVMNVGNGDVEHVAKGQSPKWNADSTAIIYSNSDAGKNFSLWQRPFPLRTDSPAFALTIGRGRDIQPTVARDGSKIVFAGADLSFNVETIDFDDAAGIPVGTPAPQTTGHQVSYFQSLNPDGSAAVFEVRQGYGSHLWKVVRGSAPSQLTSDPEFDDTYPRWSPDGNSIAFTRKAAQGAVSTAALWVMAPDGSGPRKLVDLAGNMSWTGDSKGIVYFSFAERQLYLYDIVSGASRQITNEPEIVPVFAVSSKPEEVIFQSLASGNIDLKVIPLSGGESHVIVATPRQDYHPFVADSGKWLYFQPDHKNFFRVPGPAQRWRPSNPTKVSDFPESGLFMDDPQISKNGRRLIYTRGRMTGDIWLLRLGS